VPNDAFRFCSAITEGNCFEVLELKSLTPQATIGDREYMLTFKVVSEKPKYKMNMNVFNNILKKLVKYANQCDDCHYIEETINFGWCYTGKRTYSDRLEEFK
jgi:hypothetical protein